MEARREFREALAGSIAQFHLGTQGHFLPIGMATCLLLSEGSPVTFDALRDELLAVTKGSDARARTLASRGIVHLEQLVADLGRGE